MGNNMYEGVKTVNELGGRCGHDCDYCSTHELRKRWEACDRKYTGAYRTWPLELVKGLGKNKQIFVCGQNDLLEAGVPMGIIETILKRNAERDQSNVYMIQTKNPGRFFDVLDWLPKNCMLGTTIETDRDDLIKKHTKAPEVSLRAAAMMNLRGMGYRTYVTIEPIMDFNLKGLRNLIWQAKPEKVFIGADSKKHDLEEPSEGKIMMLIDELLDFVDVEVKTNLDRLVPGLASGLHPKRI